MLVICVNRGYVLEVTIFIDPSYIQHLPPVYPPLLPLATLFRRLVYAFALGSRANASVAIPA